MYLQQTLFLSQPNREQGVQLDIGKLVEENYGNLCY